MKNYPVSIKHEEYTYNRKKVILDTCELRPGYFETMLMLRNGTEIVSMVCSDEKTALNDFANIRQTYQPDAEIPVLSGKYAKLRDDLRKAADAARLAAGPAEDGGTCNFDSAALSLPRWRDALVREAAKQAGCTCSDWTLYGHKHYVFYPFGIAGQANRRSRAAEAMTRALAGMGYEAMDYCQAD